MHKDMYTQAENFLFRTKQVSSQGSAQRGAKGQAASGLSRLSVGLLIRPLLFVNQAAYFTRENTALKISIYDRVRKNLQRECSSSSRRWRSEAWMFNQELGDTFKFFEKTLSDHGASLFAVKIKSLGNIMLRSRVERVGHR